MGSPTAPEASTAEVEGLRAALAAERARADFLQEALDCLPHAFYVIDVATHHVLMGNRASGLAGAPPAVTCHALTHRSAEPCAASGGHPCPIEVVRASGGNTVMEHVHFAPDGKPVHVEVHAFPIADALGRVDRMIEFCIDISARRQVEQAREQALRELGAALAEVRTLSGLIPICASCKKIRNDHGYWMQIEVYLKEHSAFDFSHSICPDCARAALAEAYGKNGDGI